MRKNLSVIEELVGTQYNDMVGLIAIDGHDPLHLFNMCRDNGIDMDKYFLLGFGLSESTIDGIGKRDSVFCHVLLIEKDKYGESVDEISAKVKNLSSVDVVKKHFHIPYSSLYTYIKRFDFTVISSHISGIPSINIVEKE
ncbi:hypothetical protein EZS27_009191 [termite gut metagenome]|uniref:Uncharacterized protein n=1 Tax=termite gut metagenome TaxID=433724 RepID=A0A5J4SCD7_9ZZZZ